MKTKKIIKFLKSSTARLAISYLVIIMVMIVGFSVVFYNTSISQLNRQLPPGSIYRGSGMSRGLDNPALHDSIEGFLRQRITEGQDALLLRLIYLNIIGLVVGGFISYYLARYTLKPIEQAMEAQSRFISDASHELRTPLTSIQTTNEVALRRKSMTVAEAKEVISSNIEEIDKLKRLSDGLLTLASQNNTKKKPKAISLQDIVSDALNQVVGIALEKNINFEDSSPKINVLAERQTLTQAVVILLDNAIKYSEPNKSIFIGGSKKNSAAYLTVRDEGPGIRATDQDHIFDRFYRSDSARNKTAQNGYGLGLSIAKKIIEQHHGKISVESALGKGSTFTIKLPLANP